MMRTDAPTLERYTAILQHLTAAPCPPRNGGADTASDARHRRAIHQALEAYCGQRLEGRPDPSGITEALARLQPPFSAARGETIAAATLRAAAVAGDPTNPAHPQAQQALAALITAQQPSGEFLLATRSDNPEPHWYHELVILHAVAAYALASNRDEPQRAVERAAEFHLNETQPDHATTEPWAVYAFVQSFDTLPLADQLIHAVQTQHPDGPDRISWMLLRDALYCLRDG